MASYHLSVKPIARASGRSAVASAAYRAGERLVNERDGVVHDYTHRRDVVHAEIVPCGGPLLEGVDGRMDRAALWNAAEAVEGRKDARTAREVEIALPAELSGEDRRALAVGFARALAERYGVAVDVAIHAPHEWGDQRNHHAHLLMTTRRVEGLEEGGGVRLGEKSDLELSDTKRKARGLGRAAEEIESIRGLWAGLQNQALEQAREAARVDHRSFKRRGLEVTPTQHLGPAAAAQERRGVETERGDRNRAVRAEREASAALVLARGDLHQERIEQRERQALLAVKPEDEGLVRAVEADRRERLEHAVALAERRVERRERKVRDRQIAPAFLAQAKRMQEWLRERLERVGEWVLEKIAAARRSLGLSVSGPDPERVAAGVEAFKEKFALRQQAEAGAEKFRQAFEQRQALKAEQHPQQQNQQTLARGGQPFEPGYEPDQRPQHSRGRSRSRDHGPEL